MDKKSEKTIKNIGISKAKAILYTSKYKVERNANHEIDEIRMQQRQGYEVRSQYDLVLTTRLHPGG